MKKILNYHIIVSGRVQGVGYRAFVSKIAIGFGLKGYVKNKLDGTVQVEIEGKEEMLDEFVSLCKRGSGWAHVQKIDVRQSPFRGFSEFKIKY